MRVAAISWGVVLAGISAAFTFQNRGENEPGVMPPAALTSAEEPAVDPWERPAGPVRIALQAGHWRAAEAPDEQSGLRTNGTRGGGKAEWEVNLEIARRTATLLEHAGFVVEILPTTIPPGYWADLFVSIHADGSPSPNVSGFRAAAPRRDITGRAAEFAELLERHYAAATGLPRYPTVTRRMVNYYAFNSRRYEHALHPRTVGVILETGFLTSPADRRVIVSAPERAAQGISAAVSEYLAPLLAEWHASTGGSAEASAAAD